MACWKWDLVFLLKSKESWEIIHLLRLIFIVIQVSIRIWRYNGRNLKKFETIIIYWHRQYSVKKKSKVFSSLIVISQLISKNPLSLNCRFENCFEEVKKKNKKKKGKETGEATWRKVSIMTRGKVEVRIVTSSSYSGPIRCWRQRQLCISAPVRQLTCCRKPYFVKLCLRVQTLRGIQS